MKMEKVSAELDRHTICEIGRLFWGDNKQCYSADAVLGKAKEMFRLAPPQTNALRALHRATVFLESAHEHECQSPQVGLCSCPCAIALSWREVRKAIEVLNSL